MDLNKDLLIIEDQLKAILMKVKGMQKINNGDVELTLGRIEGKVEILRELIDFRMGKFN